MRRLYNSESAPILLGQNYSLLKEELRGIRSALWFRPTAFSILAALVAVFIGTADSYVPPDMLAWLPSVDLQTVKDLLRLLAGSMLTITTVSLSVIIVVLSIATGQASPRAVPELIADPVTQNALGTFLASFVYSLSSLLLFGLGVIDEAGVTLIFIVTLLFVINSVRYLVQWIHHIAESLKLNRIIQRVFRQAQKVLESYLNEGSEGEKFEAQKSSKNTEEIFPKITGYIQLTDKTALKSAAEEFDLRIKLLIREGAFAHPHLPIMQVAGLPEEKPEILEELRSAVVIGAERSPEGDPLLGFELLAEIACRALSTGINDPQTAITCIHYNGSLLALAATVSPECYPSEYISGGRIELVHPRFEDMLERAFRPIARDGARFSEILRAVLGVLSDLAVCCAGSYLESIGEEADRVSSFGLSDLHLERDKAELRAASARVKELIAERTADNDASHASRTP